MVTQIHDTYNIPLGHDCWKVIQKEMEPYQFIAWLEKSTLKIEKIIGTRAASMTPIAWSNIPEDLQ